MERVRAGGTVGLNCPPTIGSGFHSNLRLSSHGLFSIVPGKAPGWTPYIAKRLTTRGSGLEAAISNDRFRLNCAGRLRAASVEYHLKQPFRGLRS